MINLEDLSKELEPFDTTADEFLHSLDWLNDFFNEYLSTQTTNVMPSIRVLGHEADVGFGNVMAYATFPDRITFLPYNIIKNAQMYSQATDYSQINIPPMTENGPRFSPTRGVLYGLAAFVCAHEMAHIYQRLYLVLYSCDSPLTKVDGEYRKYVERGANAMALSLIETYKDQLSQMCSSDNVTCSIDVTALTKALKHKYGKLDASLHYQLATPDDLVEQFIRDDVLRGQFADVMELISDYDNAYIRFHLHVDPLVRYVQFKSEGRYVNINSLAWAVGSSCSNFDEYKLRIQLTNLRPLDGTAPIELRATKYTAWVDDPKCCTLEVFIDEPAIYPILPALPNPSKIFD